MECREMLKDKAVMVRVTSHMAIRHFIWRSGTPESLSLFPAVGREHLHL
jgi:hypothetical protein